MRIFGIAGWSGSGKTTLMVRLIPALRRLGVEVATIKHTHHEPTFGDAEAEALAAVGAGEVLTASPRSFSLLHANEDGEPPLARLAAAMGGADLLLVEGFKAGSHPRLEVWDPNLGKPMLAETQREIVAIACDHPAEGAALPTFRRDDVDAIARFILSYCM
ncbi:MAG TPA: molybdopterin-guanine dinucleotide biosynthesis protein B [Magnetospirillum sp.]|jgi:molybdopterin-guanine dinucleotide biosynthesis protein B|nr:molybdopterin-guanine dinucleotide biosynthesis protein B [Magnetospirillum sp.]